jgi:hypothetical protein
LYLFRGAEGQTKAEIKPVEPDQDNACAGKDRAAILSFPVFVNQTEAMTSGKQKQL